MAKLKEVTRVGDFQILYTLADGTHSSLHADPSICTLIERAWRTRWGPWIDGDVDSDVDRDVVVQVELQDGTKVLLAEGNHLGGYCDHYKLYPNGSVKRFRTRR